jgi:tyrosyl-tRNA synthetase
MQDAFSELQARGLIYQTTDEEALKKLLAGPPRRFYVGFDPTARSLHVGSLIPIMAMRIMQRHGHIPVALVGGGTGMVGDPSGKTESRRLLDDQEIEANCQGLAAQIGRYLVLDGVRGLRANNADWLRDLKYIEFLRDIGRHFSVNRMLSAESYKMRLETGLTFLEFNYMLLQAYDFLKLAEEWDCCLQLGGQDQWGNIVAGVELIRRASRKEAFGLTLPLLTNASGEKFGKSVAGAVWLDAERTSVFDFYQFWRNTEDADVARFLKIFTDLPPVECEQLGAIPLPLLNRSKEILAFEATRMTHGAEAATAAYLAARAAFGTADPEGTVATSSDIVALDRSAGADAGLTVVTLACAQFPGGVPVLEALKAAGFAASNGEARRLVRGGGVRLDDQPISDENLLLSQGSVILKAGKKRMVKLVLE